MGAGTVVSTPHPLMQPEKLGRILTDIATNAAPTAIVADCAAVTIERPAVPAEFV